MINPVLSNWNLEASESIRHHHQASLQLFEELIESGVCREQARGVLPQNMLTEYYATVNLNNLFKFIILRTHEGAQVEIQEVARAMLAIIEELYPKTVKYFKESQGELH